MVDLSQHVTNDTDSDEIVDGIKEESGNLNNLGNRLIAKIKITLEHSRFFLQVIGGILLVMVGITIGYVLFSGDKPLVNDGSGYTTNLYTEIMGIVVTVFIIDLLARRREDKRQKKHEEEQLRADLIANAGSTANDIAKNAIDKLRRQGWLEGQNGLLHHADLAHADLRGAKLGSANLSYSDLYRAILERADLWNADISNANLEKANLRGALLRSISLHNSFLLKADLRFASLKNAKLQQANLYGADLESADLSYAHLEGTNLTGTNLKNSTLFEIFHDNKTLLPDGSKWADNPDTTCFTDPKHPSFWQGYNLTKMVLRDRNFSYNNLKGANLFRSDLERALLSNTDLRGASLIAANLRSADLTHAIFDENTVLPDETHWTPDTDLKQYTDPTHSAFWRGYDLNGKDLWKHDLSHQNLKGAHMSFADLESALLNNCDLRKAQLNKSCLVSASLLEAHLEGTNLHGTDLTSADLTGAKFDTNTKLPDASCWTPDCDLARFTDPSHSHFWHTDKKSN